MFRVRCADVSIMVQLEETRWRRYGHDRVYVKVEGGDPIGHIDLKSGEISVDNDEFADEIAQCRDRWMGEPTTPPTAPPSFEPPAAPPEPGPPAQPNAIQDLSANAPGATARAKRNEINAQAPVRNLAARLVGKKTDERNRRVGAKGEEMVGKELAKLGSHWRVLHSIEVSNRGSYIDHLVIGPAGVFSLNTSRRPRAKVVVSERSVRVNDRGTDYLKKAHGEATRVGRLLSAARGPTVHVQPAVVFVSLESFEVSQQPPDVHVTTRERLVPWLEALPIVQDSTTIQSVYDIARLSATWS